MFDGAHFQPMWLHYAPGWRGVKGKLAWADDMTTESWQNTVWPPSRHNRGRQLRGSDMIIAHEPKQDPRKPQRGGMTARGGKHVAAYGA